MDTIDYRLSDPYLDPPGADESAYSEHTIRLPHSFWCYDPLEGRDISVGPCPSQEKRVVTFGCLNNFCKVADSILPIWAEVLRQVENSQLLLLVPEGSARLRVLNCLSKEGIDPTRIQFNPRLSRKEYFESYHRIDICLDSFPYNGHTTSLDSLWMGVPVITLVGQRPVSRAGWCLLSNMGLTELAAQTPQQFVQIAVDLAHDRDRLQSMRGTLRQRMLASPLMDAPMFARDVEAAYRQMWRTWCEKHSGNSYR